MCFSFYTHFFYAFVYTCCLALSLCAFTCTPTRTCNTYSHPHTCTHTHSYTHTLPPILAQKQQEELPDLSPQEVVRRLRLLGQPATYFGEVQLLVLCVYSCWCCVRTVAGAVSIAGAVCVRLLVLCVYDGWCCVYVYRRMCVYQLLSLCLFHFPCHPLYTTHAHYTYTTPLHPPHNTPHPQQTDFDRLKRLKKAEQEVQLEDEAAGGGMQDNLALKLKRQEEAQQELAKQRAVAAGEGLDQRGGAKGGGVDATQEDAPEHV